MATKSDTSKEFTKSEIIKLAQADPKLAESVYHNQLASEAQQAFTKFQHALSTVPKNGHTNMYNYVYFGDLEATVNKAMQGTGLSWHQYPNIGKIVTIPQLDNHGKPAFQTDYHKTHTVTKGYGKYKHTNSVFDPLINQNGEQVPVYTKGQEVSVTTVITYKNGYPLTHGEMSAVAQSTDPQDVGSAMTYCRRYSLSIATGANSDRDTDGSQQGQSNGAYTKTYTPYTQTQLSGPQTDTPQPKLISASQTKMLSTLSNQVAKKFKQKPVAITSYLAKMYGNGTSLSSIQAGKFNSAKSYLEGHLTA